MKLAELQRELESRLTEMRTEHETSIRLMVLQHQETIARIEAGRNRFCFENKMLYIRFLTLFRSHA